MTDVNNYIQNLSDTYDFIEIIHWHNNLTNGTYGCANSSYFADTVHPNMAGQKILGEQLWREIFDSVDYTQTLQLQYNFYQNASDPFNGTEPDLGNNNLTIGARSTSAYPYNGYIENLMIFNTSLNSSDLNNIFLNNRTGINLHSNLVSNWRFQNSLADSKGTNGLLNNHTAFSVVDGIAAFFNFDGNINDSSILNYTSGAIVRGANTSEAGKYNQGLSVNGTNASYVNFSGMNPSLQLLNINFTISAWVKIRNDTEELVHFIFGNNFSGGGYGLGVSGGHI
jgi:hypothetical protein